MKDYTLNQLVSDYNNYIKTIITNSSNTLTEENKEEILEDTIFNVYRKLDSINEDILKPYIAKTAKNLVINKIKNNEKYDADSLNEMNDENSFEVEDINSNVLYILSFIGAIVISIPFAILFKKSSSSHDTSYSLLNASWVLYINSPTFS